MNGMSRQDRRISLVCRHRSAQEYQDNEFVLDVPTLVRSKHILSTYLSVIHWRRPGKWDDNLGREVGRSRDGPPLVPRGTSPLTESSCLCTAKGKGRGGWVVGLCVLCWTYGGRRARSALALRLFRFSIRRSIRSASAPAMPVLTVFRQFTLFEASSSKRVQLIPHSLSVLLTLFRYVLWLPRFGTPVVRRP